MGVPFGRRGTPIFIRGTVMAESERRRKYRYNRVLIETERILDPQFDDAVVYLTGAQVEMLRNVTQYLNRLDTYVTEYAEGYYLAPTAETYDSILEIVADLEETLMGNPNVIWGYKDKLQVDIYEDEPDAGTNTLSSDAVPANEVHVITDTVVTRAGAGTSAITLGAVSPGHKFYLMEQQAPGNNTPYNWQGCHVLKEGEYLSAVFYSVLVDDVIQFRSRGYIMQVP